MIGLLAGDPSGDNLSAGLMAALRQQLGSAEQIEFIGVGGPAMICLLYTSPSPRDS